MRTKAAVLRGIGSGNPFEEIPRMLGLYQAGRLKLDELITARYRLEDVSQGYQDMLDGRNSAGCSCTSTDRWPGQKTDRMASVSSLDSYDTWCQNR